MYMYIKELLPLYELCDHCTDIVVFIVVICSVKNSTVKSFIFVDIKFVIFNKRGRYFSMAYMYLDLFFEVTCNISQNQEVHYWYKNILRRYAFAMYHTVVVLFLKKGMFDTRLHTLVLQQLPKPGIFKLLLLFRVSFV